MSDLHQHISASFSAQGLMTTLGAKLHPSCQGEVQIALFLRPELSQQHDEPDGHMWEILTVSYARQAGNGGSTGAA